MSEQRVDLTKIQGIVEGLVPKPSQWDEVDVEIDLNNEMFSTLLQAMYTSMDQEVALAGGRLSFSLEDWILYNQYIIQQRVYYVRQNKKAEFGPRDRLYVPAILNVLNSCIGFVEHSELGILLWPDIKEPVKMLQKDVQDMASKVSVLKSHGFTFAEGYPRSKKGDWHFMTMYTLNNKIVSHSSEAHPVYAALASILMIDTAVKKLLLPRVEYGEVVHMRRYIQEFAHPRRYS